MNRDEAYKLDSDFQKQHQEEPFYVEFDDAATNMFLVLGIESTFAYGSFCNNADAEQVAVTMNKQVSETNKVSISQLKVGSIVVVDGDDSDNLYLVTAINLALGTCCFYNIKEKLNLKVSKTFVQFNFLVKEESLENLLANN